MTQSEQKEDKTATWLLHVYILKFWKYCNDDKNMFNQKCR